LKEAIAEHLALARGHGWATPGRILLGVGATHALFCAAKTILDPGDEVILCAPYWPLAPGVFHACGARLVDADLSQALYADPSADVGEILRARLGPRTRGVYFVSPNNPDGKVLSADHLAAILAFAEAHDLWIFADEVYADIVYEGAHASMGAIEAARDRTVILHSFSKSHALAGARVGYAIVPEAVLGAAHRVSTHTVFNVPLASQELCARALEHGPAWSRGVLAEYTRTRDLVVAALARARDLSFFAPEGGAYVFVDFTRRIGGDPPRALWERFIEAGVLVAPGAAFGASYASWARICFTGAPRDEVLRAIDRLVETL
jgi:aspartate/methionine/tyrosine aminotransferase